ncbi:MAG: hypothetical protein IT423_06255, partial [Pirellulaceae bacterium]|nr:hypothetical protein [Pirellulaceae bacterium]
MIWFLLLFTNAVLAQEASTPVFRAGAVAVDVTPTQPTSIIAGGFLEARANSINDKLFVRAIVLDDGSTQIALAVVDTCMMTQALIDKAKGLAASACGIPVDRILVSATHTHSAPAAMGCLGTRPDEPYAAELPIKIADAIVAAHAKRQPARIGWSSVDDWQHTHNRRWIRKPESLIVDPFGNATGRAHMHPGYLSRDVIGPSGPVDPGLSVISLQTLDGQPLAVLANYSQHYFGAKPVSADYYGLFAKSLATALGQPGDGNGPFVCAMSQGTSGDLMWMDYGSPSKTVSVSDYAAAVAAYAEKALANIQYQNHVPLAMVEKTLPVKYRTPDPDRLQWAQGVAKSIVDGLPKNLPEVYAQEALILHERQQTSIKLQAIRIGDLTIATLPNEVYALTGLKLKARSPGAMHFNVELANGAEGYIPPPEQHTLGGYTTWPARTAGLAVDAEPQIVETLLVALEEATGKPRRTMTDEHGPYAQSVLAAKPAAYWRLNDEDGNQARNAVSHAPAAKLTGGFAWYLPGAGSGSGIGDEEHLTRGPFSGPKQINRAVHLASGQISASLPNVERDFTINLWFWLGQPSGASDRSGTLCTLPDGQSIVVQQDRSHSFSLALGTGVTTGTPDPSGTQVTKALGRADDWHMLSIVGQDNQLKCFLDGATEPVLHISGASASAAPSTSGTTLTFGTNLQGKLDELSVFNRPLSPVELSELWQQSGMAIEHLRAASLRAQASVGAEPPAASKTPKFADTNDPTDKKQASTTASTPAGPSSQPLSPEQSLAALRIAKGFRAELVVAEPLVLDPVAFDWGVDGRMWVVEMADYPSGMDGKGQPGGRIRVLKDVDGDGRYDESHLFAEGLNFPNGILTWRDGVIVTAAPHILFLRDSDGDGRAEAPEILFEGFQQGNQQLRLNGLRWGLDGWVYCANGGHHANYGVGTKVTSRRLGQSFEIGSRDFRFRPDSGELVLESGPSQYGRNRDAAGHWFGVQNAKPLWHYVIADRYLARNPHVPTTSPIHFVLPPGSPPVYPASQPEKRFHSFKEAGHFTSACSGMIYNDQWLFGRTSQLHAFTCEPFHNLIQHNVLSDQGVSFDARRPVGEGRYDFFASEDRWTRPVMVRTGPDGALWVADMYRYMIEHPDWLPPEGKQELLPHYRLGDDRGRIYRILPEDREAVHAWPFPDQAPATLLKALQSTNDWTRDKAQQLLLWSVDQATVTSILPQLEQLVRHDERSTTRLQALHTLHTLHSRSAQPSTTTQATQLHPTLVSIVKAALSDSDARVREAALQLAEQSSDSGLIQTALRVDDPDPKFCLQLALSIGQWPDRAAGEALVLLARRFYTDAFMRTAIMSSSLAHGELFAQGIAASTAPVKEAFRDALIRQAIGAQDGTIVAQLLSDSLQSAQQGQLDALDGLLLTVQRLGTSLEKLKELDPDADLASQWPTFEKVVQQWKATMEDTTAPTAKRIAAARTLSRLASHRPLAVESLAQWLGPQVDLALQQEAIAAMAQSADQSVPKHLAKA